MPIKFYTLDYLYKTVLRALRSYTESTGSPDLALNPMEKLKTMFYEFCYLYCRTPIWLCLDLLPYSYKGKSNFYKLSQPKKGNIDF